MPIDLQIPREIFSKETFSELVGFGTPFIDRENNIIWDEGHAPSELNLAFLLSNLPPEWDRLVREATIVVLDRFQVETVSEEDRIKFATALRFAILASHRDKVAALYAKIKEKEMENQKERKDKLHAILAVEKDLRARATAKQTEVASKFRGDPEAFVQQTRTYSPFREDDVVFPQEHKEMGRTVGSLLEEVSQHTAKFFDAFAQKEITNTVAKAEIVIGGTTYTLPTTLLLNLEKFLEQVKVVYLHIPELTEGEHWTLDEEAGKGIYKARDSKKLKTEKQLVPIEMAKATDRHPAQVQAVNKDVPIGEWLIERKCSMWPVNKKQAVIERIDSLIEDIKRARQHANEQPLEKVNIGKQLFDYINADV